MVTVNENCGRHNGQHDGEEYQPVVPSKAGFREDAHVEAEADGEYGEDYDHGADGDCGDIAGRIHQLWTLSGECRLF